MIPSKTIDKILSEEFTSAQSKIYFDGLKKSIEYFIHTYNISFWFKIISLVSFIVGFFIQSYKLGKIGAWKFFSSAQVLVDGIFSLGLFLYSILVMLFAYEMYIFLRKYISSKIFMLLLLLPPLFIILFFSDKNGILTQSIIMILAVQIAWCLNLRSWRGTQLFLYAIMWTYIGINIYIGNQYNSTEINGKMYKVYYLSQDYIFTKEGYIFDRNGNKFINNDN